MMSLRRGLKVGLCCVFYSAAAFATTDSTTPLVMLLHGQARTSVSMWKAESFLEDNGLLTDNWNYDGFFSSIDQLGDELVARINERKKNEPSRPIYFLTHSLGGIVVRQALSKWETTEQSRVVMLAPPNQGAKVADKFSPWISWFLRPMSQLTTGPDSFIANIPRMKSAKTLVIRAKDDILVSQEETLLPEAEGYDEVDTGHTTILWDDQALNKAVQFFKN